MESKDELINGVTSSISRERNLEDSANFASQALIAFEDEIHNLLSHKNQVFISLVSKIKMLLRQYNLHRSYSWEYIFNEAYLRGLKLVKSGEEIRVPSAWLRITSYNIVREISREERSQILISNLDLDNNSPILPENRSDLSASDFEPNRDLILIRLAFQMLSTEEQELLKMKVVNNLSWAEIRKSLNLRGDSVSEPGLRKRKERALKKLRNLYHKYASTEVHCSGES